VFCLALLMDDEYVFSGLVLAHVDDNMDIILEGTNENSADVKMKRLRKFFIDRKRMKERKCGKVFSSDLRKELQGMERMVITIV